MLLLELFLTAMKKYNYTLIVTDELDNVVVEITKPNFEMIEERYRDIEAKIKEYEKELKEEK